MDFIIGYVDGIHENVINYKKYEIRFNYQPFDTFLVKFTYRFTR